MRDILWLSVGGGGKWWIYFGCRWVPMDSGGYILVGGGWWWIYFGWWWVVVDGGEWLWEVVGGDEW